MDDLSSVIGQLLNDPERMQGLMEAAKNLLPQEITAEKTPLDPERVTEIGKLLQGTGASNPKQEALIQALRPYLRPGRRSKLDRALQIAKLSHIAGIALKKDLIP